MHADGTGAVLQMHLTQTCRRQTLCLLGGPGIRVQTPNNTAHNSGSTIPVTLQSSPIRSSLLKPFHFGSCRPLGLHGGDVRAHLEDGEVGSHAAVPAAAEADEGEGRGLVLVAWRHESFRLEGIRLGEHVRQPV